MSQGLDLQVIKQCIENLQRPIQIYASWNEISWSKKNQHHVLISKISTSYSPDNIEDYVWSFKDRDHLLIMFLSECLKEDNTLQDMCPGDRIRLPVMKQK